MSVMVVDGPGLAHRAYHVHGGYSATSQPHVEMFAKMLNKLIREHKPAETYVAWDAPGGATWRRKLIPEYKAQRRRSADTGVHIREIRAFCLKEFGLLQLPDYEADDVLSIVADVERRTREVLLVSDDKDVFQCLAPGVRQHRPGQKDTIDHWWVFKKYGVQPAWLPRVYALAGDASDNLKGIPGVGIKRACEMVATYASLEMIRDVAMRGGFTPAVNTAVVEHWQAAVDTLFVFTLKCPPMDDWRMKAKCAT